MSVYIDQLIANCQLAKEAKLKTSWELTGEQDLERMPEVQKAIYLIEEIDGDAVKTFEAFKRYKDQKVSACPKLNEPSGVMYVGSSVTGVKKRIRQHIVDAPKGTYALRLPLWFTGRYKVTIFEYAVSDDVLQIIEDDFAYRKQPAFGKRGGNNK